MALATHLGDGIALSTAMVQHATARSELGRVDGLLEHLARARGQAQEERHLFAQLVLDGLEIAWRAMRGELDLVDVLDRLGDRLAHVHLSNNAGKGWDSHLPLDQGVLDLGRFLEVLAGRGYGGAVSLEIDLRPHLDDDEALRRILVRNRELCAERLGLAA